MKNSNSTCRYCKWRGMNDNRCYYGYEQGEVVKYNDSCSHFTHAADDDEPVGYVRGIILCKDCKFNEIPYKANVLCEKGMPIYKPYGYCSEGERRTNE